MKKKIITSDYNPRELKVGDVLIYHSYNGINLSTFTENKEYVVEGFYDHGYGIIITTDSGLIDQVCNTNVERYFYLVIGEDSSDSTDSVNHPKHYSWLKDKCGIEVIDITRHLDFDLGNAIKYILRAGHKEDASLTNTQKEIEDLKKAIFYINDRIAQIEGKYDKDK